MKKIVQKLFEWLNKVNVSLTYDVPDGSIMYSSGPVCGSHDAKIMLTPNGRTAEYSVYAWMKLDKRSFNTFNGIGRLNCCL